jgi:sortase B
MPKQKQNKTFFAGSVFRQIMIVALALALTALSCVGALAAQQTQTAAQSVTNVKRSAAIDLFAAEKSGFANIKAYRAVNSDVKGWLKIPGTNIDYPVLHDNRVFLNAAVPHFYLDKNLYKQQSRNGVIYASPSTTFGKSANMSRNTVLFGHNWTNVSANPRIGSANDVMFAQLTSFHHLSFAKQHPYIYYSTADQEMTWVVFAAFYTDMAFDYINPNPDSAGMVDLITGARLRSRHIYDVEMKTNDKILTLSTCTRAYGKSAQQRFVVMARLLRPNEQLTDISISANPKPILPKL